MAVITRMVERLWTPWLLGLFLAVGLYYSVRTGFFQIFGARRWLGDTAGTLLRRRPGEGGLSQFQVLATALASTIGTGSIAGVATAIFFGGPGAVFWMWVSALLGMMTGCAEKILAVRYRRRTPDGRWQGGPMCCLAYGVGSPLLAGWFAAACVGGALVGGNLVQSNSIAMALESALGWDRLAVGIATALLAGAVLSGGLGRIARVSELLVPVMALLFLGSGAVVLAARAEHIPGALEQIFTCALTPGAGAGGAAGYTVTAAMRYGVARGVFTNEAGMGSSALVHASSGARRPGEQGMWGILEVFVATILVCTVTALVILTAGVYDPAAALSAIVSGELSGAAAGAPLTARSFAAVLGSAGEGIVAVCLLLFAFSSLLGWSYYGEAGLGWLLGGERWRKGYRALFLLTAAAGGAAELTAVWELVDLFTALMALPNLTALILLSPQALSELRAYLEAGERREGASLDRS